MQSKLTYYISENELKKETKQTVRLFNAEEESCNFICECGSFYISDEGNIVRQIFSEKDIKPIQILTKKNLILPKESIDIEFVVDPQLIDMKMPVNSYYIAVRQAESTKSITTETENVGIQVLYEFLIQVYVKTKKAPIGDLKVEQVKVEDQKIHLYLKNDTENMLNSKIAWTFFDAEKALDVQVENPIRLLPNNQRHIAIPIPSGKAEKCSVIIDDPYFSFFKNDIIIK
jgi:hypothetical protein